MSRGAAANPKGWRSDLGGREDQENITSDLNESAQRLLQKNQRQDVRRKIFCTFFQVFVMKSNPEI